jgi:hypothetical protein
MLTSLNFVHASYFSYCGLQGYNTLYSSAAVFLQPVSTVLQEHMLSNPEDHNTNIKNESLNSLVNFVLIHHWMLLLYSLFDSQYYTNLYFSTLEFL